MIAFLRRKAKPSREEQFLLEQGWRHIGDDIWTRNEGAEWFTFDQAVDEAILMLAPDDPEDAYPR